MQEYRCRGCGWQGEPGQIPHTIVYEPWGDVDVWKCPECGAVDYEGRELFVEVEEAER